MKKATKLLNEIKKNPMTYGEMQGFLFKLSDNGVYDRSCLTKNGHPRGYWCTNLRDLIDNELISKNDNGKYCITRIGEAMKDMPFSEKKMLYSRERLIKASTYYKEPYYNMREKYYEEVEEHKLSVQSLKNEIRMLKKELDDYKKSEEINLLSRILSEEEFEFTLYSLDIIERIKERLIREEK